MSISIGAPATHPIRHIPSGIINIIKDRELDRLDLPYIWVNNYYILIFNIEDYFGIPEEEYDYGLVSKLGVVEEGIIDKVNLTLLNALGVVLL